PNLEVPLEIGSRFGGGVPYAGTIDEVAFYNRALTPAQIQQHWSMSWLAPWITQQPPATLAGFEPDPAIITAAAAGYPNTYQWFKDGQPLTPETNPDGSQHYQDTNSTVLTITQSTPKDNGRYHLEVFNPLGNTASTPTVLTVLPDLSQPKVVHVTADSSMFRVRVTFDRWVTPETASVFDNYTFTGGVTANNVALT